MRFRCKLMVIGTAIALLASPAFASHVVAPVRPTLWVPLSIAPPGLAPRHRDADWQAAAQQSGAHKHADRTEGLAKVARKR